VFLLKVQCFSRTLSVNQHSRHLNYNKVGKEKLPTEGKILQKQMYFWTVVNKLFSFCFGDFFACQTSFGLFPSHRSCPALKKFNIGPWRQHVVHMNLSRATEFFCHLRKKCLS
jgi:hypothetical protein